MTGCASTPLWIPTGNDDLQILSGRARIKSIKISVESTATTTIKFYDTPDSDSSNDKKFFQFDHSGTIGTFDFDFHGAIVGEGLFGDCTANGANVTVSVQHL